MAKEVQRPKVGLGIILMKYDSREVLLGKRKNAHGDGTWSFPGGHLEFFETFYECADREMFEETGLVSGKNYTFNFSKKNPVAVTNDFFNEEQKHYITLYMCAKYIQGEPRVTEPDKCEGWRWYKWEKLPELNLFTPVKNLIKQRYNPFA